MKTLLFTFILLTGSLGAFAQDTHKVESTQTLYSISRLYGVTLQDLMEWNQLSDYQIKPGQVLIVKSTPGTSVQLIKDTYVIRAGDSLSEIAFRYSVAMEDLMKLNHINEAEHIRVGQRIYIRQPLGIQIHKVQPGDSLSLLATRFKISQKDLKQINSLTTDVLKIGQELRVSRPGERPLTHEVKGMDTLSGVAALYQMPEQKIAELNKLTSPQLQTGQVLKLQDYASASVAITSDQKAPAVSTASTVSSKNNQSPERNEYVVESGDTLFGLSRRFKVSLEDLKSWNQLKGDQIRKGQTLIINSTKSSEVTFQNYTVPQTNAQNSTQNSSLNTAQSSETAENEVLKTSVSSRTENLVQTARDPEAFENLTWDGYVVLNRDIPLFEWNNDYYYWSHPGQITQPSRGYYENRWDSPLDAYEKSSSLWKGFQDLLDKKPRKSGILSGYTIVLDPGHGGLDPGAIVKSSDGNGDVLYITEDEYVYDIALRMVPLLKEHGADVELTILAPNHLIRDTTPATKTLINEKNEVYNDRSLNQPDTVENWIAGGAAGLLKRVKVAEAQYLKYPKNKRIFISIHADNSPKAPMGTGIYYQEGTAPDAKSKAVAEKMIPFVGKNGYVRGADLAVLRNNSADFKLLFEIRNVAYQEHSWALRFANTRQSDALKIVKGVLENFKTGN